MMASSNSIQGGRSGWGLAPGRRWEGMLAGIVVGLLVLSACSGSSKYFHDAVNEATRKVDEAMQSKLGAFSGGLPGMM